MMIPSEIDPLDMAYDTCLMDGCITELDAPDNAAAKLLVEQAAQAERLAKELSKAIERRSPQWKEVYTHHYQCLKLLSSALLLLAKQEAETDHCLFAALLIKYPTLELDWGFFERLRSKHEAITQHGEATTYEDWKSVELQLTLYLSAMRAELNKKQQ